ncbi:MAG: mechanosensitive ion channel [Candidatus Methanomethylophilaceae archaeon]|nr:mechanosensitive ion channel [Candidatus Methanomethylophilaceae archaeon]
MQRRSLVIIAIMLVLLCTPLAVSDASGSSSYTINGAVISTFDDSVQIPAGKTKTLTVDVYNGNENTTVVGISLTSTDLNASLSTKELSLEKNKMGSFAISITTDKLMNHGHYSFEIKLTVYDFGTKTTESGTITFQVTVTSPYSDGSAYNRILGIFDPLPSPLDTVEITVVVTLILWFIIAVVAHLILMFVLYLLIKQNDEVKRNITRGTGILMFVGIMVTGISNALDVAGAGDFFIATTMGASKIIYRFIGAGIAWNLYHSAIEVLFHRLEDTNRLDGVDTSLIPLFRMLGMLVIIIITASSILSVLGFDLAAIITGVGVAGMAVSLGAQSTLTQFFSGLNLMITRPFKIGDMVSIGDDKNIYEVKKIGMMNSTFKNWANQEYCVMPNDTVASSRIVNVTGVTMAYKMYLYYFTSYDADVDLAKKVIMDEALKNPNVVTDGSYSAPEVRLEDFDPSAIKYRLSIYIHNFRDNVKVTGQLNQAIYDALLKEGIDCPYDMNDVHIFRQ